MEEDKLLFTTMCRVTILINHVILNARVFNPSTFVRSFVNAQVTVENGSQDVAVKLNATPNNVHVFWLFVNVTRISVLNVALTKWMYPRLPVGIYSFKEVSVKGC